LALAPLFFDFDDFGAGNVGATAASSSSSDPTSSSTELISSSSTVLFSTCQQYTKNYFLTVIIPKYPASISGYP
jgi:hypothetical protein